MEQRDRAALPPSPAEALGRGPDGRAGPRASPGCTVQDLADEIAESMPSGSRWRWWSAAATSSAAPPADRGDGPGHRRPHGHAGHADQRPGAAGRAGAARLDTRVLSALEMRQVAEPFDPPPGPAPPGEGPGRDPGGRHRQPVLHHRQRRRPAGHGDQGRGAAQGDQGGRRLHRRPGERPEREVPEEG